MRDIISIVEDAGRNFDWKPLYLQVLMHVLSAARYPKSGEAVRLRQLWPAISRDAAVSGFESFRPDGFSDRFDEFVKYCEMYGTKIV